MKNLLHTKKTLIAIVTVILMVSYSCNIKTKKEYKTAIENADALYKRAEYTKSKAQYTKATKLMPEEKYPKQKIAKINKILKARKIEKDYKVALQNGDAKYAEQNYAEAKKYFEKAAKLKPKQKHPKEMLSKINAKLAEIAKQEEAKKYPYHIIVGCFTVKENADRMFEKLSSQGNNPQIISLYGGKYSAVSAASFPDIHSAYSALKDYNTSDEEVVAWVLERHL